MPVFTFEKILPPLAEGAPDVPAPKRRGVIIQMLDRFVEARVKRTVLEEKAAMRGEQKPQEQ